MGVFVIIVMTEIVLQTPLIQNVIMIDMEEVKAQAKELGMTVEEWFREFVGVIDIEDCNL